MAAHEGGGTRHESHGTTSTRRADSVTTAVAAASTRPHAGNSAGATASATTATSAATCTTPIAGMATAESATPASVTCWKTAATIGSSAASAQTEVRTSVRVQACTRDSPADGDGRPTTRPAVAAVVSQKPMSKMMSGSATTRAAAVRARTLTTAPRWSSHCIEIPTSAMPVARITDAPPPTTAA